MKDVLLNPHIIHQFQPALCPLFGTAHLLARVILIFASLASEPSTTWRDCSVVRELHFRERMLSRTPNLVSGIAPKSPVLRPPGPMMACVGYPPPGDTERFAERAICLLRDMEDKDKERKMKQGRWSSLLPMVMFAVVLSLGGCKKKVAPPTPPAPPPLVAPTASISADSAAIEVGQSATLTWKTENATNVTLDDQPVNANGSVTVSPKESTTYRVIAAGPGGKQESAARITVTQPPPRQHLFRPPVTGNCSLRISRTSFSITTSTTCA